MRVPAWIQASPGADVGESCVRNTLARIGFAPKWMASSYADRENPNPRRSDRTMGRAQGRGLRGVQIRLLGTPTQMLASHRRRSRLHTVRLVSLLVRAAVTLW